MINTENLPRLPSVVYADIESLIKRTDGRTNNARTSFITKAEQRNLCGYINVYDIDIYSCRKEAWLIQRSRLHEKISQILKRACGQDNSPWKEQNDTINKWTVGIFWKEKNMLHLQIANSGTIVNVLLKIETCCIQQI